MEESFHSFKAELISELLLSVSDEVEQRLRFTKAFRARTLSALSKAEKLVGELDTDMQRAQKQALTGRKRKRQTTEHTDTDEPSSD